MSGPGVALTTPALPTTWLRGDEMPERICSVEGCDRPARCRDLCNMHGNRVRRQGSTDRYPRPSAESRFWKRVNRAGPCWTWTGRCFPNGYGVFTVGPRSLMAHRYSYELLVGPIPAGLVLDHLCRVRNCVNPAHLEAVTNRENILRGEGCSVPFANATHCVNGHPFDDRNTYVWRGQRKCRQCGAEKARARRAARKACSGIPAADAFDPDDPGDERLLDGYRNERRL